MRASAEQVRYSSSAIRLGAAVLGVAGVVSGACGQISRVPDAYACGKARAAALMAESRLSPDRPFANDPGAGKTYAEAYPATDVLENNLDLEFVLSPQNVHGSNTMTVKAVTAVSEFSFILHPNYSAAALINGVTPGAITTFGTWGRRVALDRIYSPGETFTVKITYDGTPPPATGFGGFVIGTRVGKPEVWSLSQPFAAGCWWPCKDGDFGLAGDNSDKATLKLAVTGPSSMKTTANGVLVGVDDLGDGRSRTRFKSDYPMSTYLVCFASTDFNTWSVPWTYGNSTMPVEFNFYSEQDSAGARNNAAQTLGMLTVFSNIFGTYPFINEKYGIYQFGFGGGMEHQTNTGQIFFDGDWLTSHELAHQWWGDNLTCRDWHHIWLNEGFATYAEALWEEFKPGSSGTPALLAAMNNRRPGNSAGSVYVTDTSSETPIFDYDTTYLKGGWVLHMLRYVVGDDAFFTGLRTYRAAHENGAVTTEDLNAAFSQVVGSDLSWFFQQWIYGTGTPNYQVSFQPVTVNGAKYCRVYLQQTQSDAMGAGGRFRMPVDLRLGANASDPVARVNNTARLQWFLLPVSSFPAGVSVDPDGRILCGKGAGVWAPGPAKVVDTAPALGTLRTAASSPTSVKVFFSEDVNINASKLTLTGPNGSVPFSLAYDAPNFAATISFAPLPAGTYTLGVSAQVTTVAAGKLLDGEMVDPFAASSLPSGDGVPGGAATLSFNVRCSSDVDNDGVVQLEDFFAFFGAWDLQQPPADINQNGTIDLEDFFAFFGAFDLGC